MNRAEIATTKHRLRERFRAARLALSDEEYARHSAKICKRLLSLPEISASDTVHVYWPLVARREVDTRPLIDALRSEGRTVVLPVVEQFDGAPTLRHVRFEGAEHMRPNRWGLLEPAGTETVALQDFDAVVVPAFGAGRDGHRIGHGRGFYDAFVRDLDAVTIGLVYDVCLVESVPAEPHDVPLDLVVTEAETCRVMGRL